jgi:hypothetical protein
MRRNLITQIDPQWPNYNGLYPVGESVRECFSNNVS